MESLEEESCFGRRDSASTRARTSSNANGLVT